MFIRRWVDLTLVVFILFAPRLASAALTLQPGSPTSVAVGNVTVNSTGTNSSISIRSSVNNVTVTVSGPTACAGGGAGTFAVTNTSDATTFDIANQDVALKITYAPTARGNRTCSFTITDDEATPNTVTFQVTGRGIAPVVATSTNPALPFPAVRIADTAFVHTATVTLTISNNGTAANGDPNLSVNNIFPTGGNSGDYEVTPNTFPQSIAPGGSQNWTVTFNPNALGASSSTIRVESNDPLTPNHDVAVSGSGGTGVIGVTSSIDFGIVSQGGQSSNSNITVTNVVQGANPRGVLRVTEASFGTTNPDGWFKFNRTGCVGTTAPCSFTMLLTSSPDVVPVICAPPAGASGMRSATVTFTSDTDASTSTSTMLTCTAGRADITVTSATDPLAFGDQVVFQPSGAQMVTIGNTGNATLTYSVSLGGADPGHFILTGAGSPTPCVTNCTVGPTSSVEVSVQFRPTTAGMKSATLIIDPLNDPDLPTQTIPIGLTGNGQAPVAQLNVTALTFGNVDVGSTSNAMPITVTNTGDAPLTISAASFTAGAADYVVGSNSAATGTSLSIILAKGDAATWNIQCKPDAKDSQPGTFRVTSNHNGIAGTHADISLSCNGLQGILTFVAPPATINTHNFGGVRQGETRSQAFTLRNDGNTPITNIAVSMMGTGTAYTITSPTFPIASLAGGTQVSVTVQFAPMNGNDGGQLVYTFAGTWGGAAVAVNTTLTVNGDGLTTGYDTSPSAPSALEFGDVRFDQTKLMPISIINTEGTTVVLRSLTITPGTAQSGEFTIVNCTRNASPINCPSATTPYTSTGVNDTIIVNVRCDPNNRVAMFDATLTVGSDLAVNPNRSLMMRCNANTAMLSINPGMALDFGPTDLDKVPVAVTRKLTITNTGTATLNFGAATKTGVGYTYSTTPASAAIPMNGEYSVDVTYTPTVERASNQPDLGSIVIPMSGVHGAPATLTISISGYGVDRHVQVAPAPTFPDTFKNPAEPPVRPVTLTNTGDATLSVSAIMLTNDPIWTIVNPAPADIPGKGTYDFNVQFSPLMAGKAPTGHLVIMNNDNGRPLIEMDFDGNGLNRNVAFGPPVIDLGYVGIGQSVRLSDQAPSELLDISNAEDAHTFKILSIDIAGGEGSFEIVESDGAPLVERDLAPRTTQKYDVVFTPTAEGDFEAMASLYLDTNVQAHATVVLRGRGLFVDARGGGGCSTAGGGTGGVMVLVLGAVLLGRRRRRRIAVASAMVAGVVGQASAEPTRDLNLTVFDHTPTTTGTTFHLQQAGVGKPGDFVISALVTYANNPLVLNTVQNDDAAVKNRTMVSLGGAYALGGKYELGARVPLYMQSGDDFSGQSTMFGIPPASGAAIGDAALHGRMLLGQSEMMDGDAYYGVGASLTVPTATKGEFVGNELPTGRAHFLFSIVHPRIATTINLGGVGRAESEFQNIRHKSGGSWGIGTSYRLLDAMWLNGEIFGDLIPGGVTTRPTAGQAMGEAKILHTIEALVGMHYAVGRTTSLGFAVGRGVTGGIGSPAARGVLTFSYTPGAPALEPVHPPEAPKPPKDADVDGIADKLDDCPNEPEDKDLFDDGDGCPENDNDNDTVADAADKCPLDAEDKDRFQDDDGCPDNDNDADQIPDGKDKCPTQAEDRDGVDDVDGCPDNDNDKDGISDKADKCPKEAETINGNADDDGCPDRGDALVVVSPDRLELLESIQFAGTSRIAKSSHNVLGQIAATLRAHREIVRVRLTVHVNPSKDAARDKLQSEMRAEAVRQWLIDWGIEPLRLQVSGFGGSKPLVPPTQKSAQQINDRVELIILERN